MVEGKRVAVVVPAFEEEHLVGETLRGIPDFVDRIYVVDDASPDETAAKARAIGDPRVEVIAHEQNGGVGAAIVTGYHRARAERIDVTCVMAADNQMDPAELADLVGPVARGEVDYTKANRLITGEAWTLIPHSRYDVVAKLHGAGQVKKQESVDDGVRISGRFPLKSAALYSPFVLKVPVKKPARAPRKGR